jgi:hypothetical protein
MNSEEIERLRFEVAEAYNMLNGLVGYLEAEYERQGHTAEEIAEIMQDERAWMDRNFPYALEKD